MNAKPILPLALLAAVLSAGCDQPEQTSDKGTQEKAPAAKAVKTEAKQETASPEPQPPAKPNSQLAAKGERLFNQNCAVCHQEDAIGEPGVAPSLTNKEFLSIASDKFLKATIRDGREGTGMPPFAHLGKEGIDAIVAFLRAHAQLPNRAARVNAQPKAKGDPRLGEIWFDQICATCHGPSGDGYAAGGTGTAIGKSGFLNKASDGFIRETIKQGRSNTRMRGFQGTDALASLSDKEIDDIIAYLRTIPSTN